MTKSPSKLDARLVSNEITPVLKAVDPALNENPASTTRKPLRRIIYETGKGFIEGGDIPPFPGVPPPSMPPEIFNPPPGFTWDDRYKLIDEWISLIGSDEPDSEEMKQAQDKWWEDMGGKEAYFQPLDEDEVWEAEKIILGIKE